MAKSARDKIRLNSSAGTGHFYTTDKNKLREIGTTHWRSPNTGATNEVGFTALGGSHRHSNGGFGTIRHSGAWWSPEEGKPTNGCARDMGYYFSAVDRVHGYKVMGLSIRCVRD